MRNPLPDILERGRVTRGEMASTSADGGYGMFRIDGPCGKQLCIVASGGDDDDDVSVSTTARIPLWREMCFIKDLFWHPQDCVVQFHPPETEYVNNHPRCLHMWRNKIMTFPLPPSIMVGIKDLGILNPVSAAAVRKVMIE